MFADNLFKGLTTLKDFRAKRCSSYDRTGRNADYVVVKPGKRHVMADIRHAGCITHIWVTHSSRDTLYRRKVVLRMWWDGEKTPSVETPLGDFFGVGHARQAAYSSFPFTMTCNPGGRGAMNCWFNMPFRKSARIEIENEADEDLVFYYYVDYEEHAAIADDVAHFHAQWRRENPCDGWKEKWHSPEWKRREKTRSGAVTDWKHNYLILAAKGRGHYVGCNLSVHNLYASWWGEGDDAIYVDGEKWPPALHGTGTEDYFCHAYGMEDQCDLFAGTSLFNRKHTLWEGKWTVYRYHILDPVPFTREIRVTIEHGEGNSRSDDYASTAYWYQMEPHAKFPKLPAVAKRLPRPDDNIGYVPFRTK